MGKSSSQTIGYWYHPAYHDGLGVGPIDAFLEFRAGDKTAWSGSLTASGTITINAPNLFGGEKDQGGIVGAVDIMFGEATQMPNAYLSANFGPQQPAWRGMTTLAFKGGKYGAMNPYPQEAAYKIKKIVKGWDDDVCWYLEKAAVGSTSEEVLVAGLVENGDDGLTPYTLVEGSLDAFSVVSDDYGAAIQSGPGSTAISCISRPLPGDIPRRISFKVKVGARDDDDLGIVTLRVGIVDVAVFNAGRESHSDALRRPTASVQGVASTPIGSTALDIGVWYEWVTEYDPGADATTSTITRTSDSVVHGAVTFSGSPISTATPTVFTIQTQNHPALGSGTVRWDDVQIDYAEFASAGHMNPAHILYYARTQADLGRESTGALDEDSFAAGADWYYSQGFGLCTEYDPSKESVADLEQRICRVAGCSVTRSLIDGKWYLDVANGIYDLESLPILTDDDILEFSEQPTLLDSAVNSVSIKYFDPQRKETIVTPPTQAPALIDEYGTNHVTLEYPEIPTAELALRVANRELLARITPLRGFPLKTTRKPYAWRPDTYFRLQAPKRGIADMVCVFSEKSSGQLRSGAMSITATQDVYSLPSTVFVEVEAGVDTAPSQTPQPITLQRAFEAPYIDVVASLPRAELAALPADVGYLEAVAVDPANSLDYSMFVQPAGGEYAETASGAWCPSATVVEAAGPGDTEFTLDDGYRLDEVTVGMPVLLNGEVCRVDAIDADLLTITLGRGCADTVPPSPEHAAGSRLWFWQAGRATDTTEYTDGETIDVKLLTNTGSQQLDVSLATAMNVEFAARAARPYPPGLFRINAAAWPDYLFGELTVSWAHRDRVLQADQVIDTDDASIGPEAGTTYTVRYYLDDVLDTQETGITGDSATPFTPSGSGQLRIELEAVRDGLASWQMHSHEFDYTSAEVDFLITEAGDYLTNESGARIILE